MADKLLYRVPEVVDVTGISRSTIYELLAEGRLESVKVGRSRLVPRDALEAFIADLRRENADAVA